MIQLYITKQSRTYNYKDFWQTFDNETKNFKNITEAKEYLKETYGKSKRVKMFVDNIKNGKSIHIGYIYGFRAGYGGDHWIENHWVEFRTIKSLKLS